mgnify:CR=1 FL=1
MYLNSVYNKKNLSQYISLSIMVNRCLNLDKIWYFTMGAIDIAIILREPNDFKEVIQRTPVYNILHGNIYNPYDLLYSNL